MGVADENAERSVPVNIGGTLEIGWYPTISWKTAEKWDARTELPKHPSYLNPSSYLVRHSDGALVPAWTHTRTEWEFCASDGENVEFAVRTYYDCQLDLQELVLIDRSPVTVLAAVVHRYHLYLDSTSYRPSDYGSAPHFTNLEDVIFWRRDELTSGRVRLNQTGGYGKERWRLYYDDRLRVWRDRFQHREEVLKVLGGPTDWNVNLTIGAFPIDETGMQFPSDEEQIEVVYELARKYHGRFYNWKKSY